MIPGFNKDGDLPEGIYSAGEKEFLDRFTTNSSRRKWLGQRLKEIFTLAKLTKNLKRIFVWGSFVSNKESPNDIDMLLLMAEDFQLEKAPE
jgi:hypothetical protein